VSGEYIVRGLYRIVLSLIQCWFDSIHYFSQEIQPLCVITAQWCRRSLWNKKRPRGGVNYTVNRNEIDLHHGAGKFWISFDTAVNLVHTFVFIFFADTDAHGYL